MTHPTCRLWCIWFFSWLFWASAAAPVRAGPPLTLEQAIQIALEKSPILSAARSSIAAAEARVRQAESAYLPQISAAGEYARTRNETQTGLFPASPEKDSYQAGLSLTQHLYDFGRTGGLVDQSRYRLVSGQNELEVVTHALVRDVKLSFFEALKKQQLVAVDAEAAQLKKRHLEQAKALYQQGMRPRIDVTRSEVEVSKSALSLLQSEYAHQQAMVTLERLMGNAPGKGAYTLSEGTRDPRLPDALPGLLSSALEKRPDLRDIEAQMRAAEALLMSAKGASWPQANAGGAYQYSGTEFPLNERWEAGVLLKWELFTGFERSGKIKESEADIRRLKALMENRKLTVFEEVIQAHLKIHETAEAHKTALLALFQAGENLKMAEGRYQAGLSNIIELLDAEVLYTQTRSAVVQTLYDHSKAWAVLEYAVGEKPASEDAVQPEPSLNPVPAKELS